LALRRHGRPEYLEDQLIDRVFAGPAESKAREGDADLRHAKQSLRIRQELQRGLSLDAAFVGQLLKPRAANGDQRYLSCCKEAVHRDDDGQEQKSQGHWLL